MNNKEYDVFISYRRETGATAAQLLRLALEKRGYSVFFDYSSLKDGKFNEAIYSAIDSCEVFILMMTEGALNRCVEEGDWVRCEILRALEKGKHIVPVKPVGQEFIFPVDLPESMSGLRFEQFSLFDVGQLLDETVNKIESERFPVKLTSRRRQVMHEQVPVVPNRYNDFSYFLMESYRDARSRIWAEVVNEFEKIDRRSEMVKGMFGSIISAGYDVLNAARVEYKWKLLPNGEPEFATFEQIAEKLRWRFGDLWNRETKLQSREGIDHLKEQVVDYIISNRLLAAS